jgi:cysteine desulfurase
MVHLSKLLMQDGLILVSLMHVNNEIGTILDIERVAKLCKQSNAYFHTDTIQSIGKIPINLAETPIDFLVASAHKFHGPKGIGFAFIRKGIYLQPHIFGGEQEKGLRAGTENIAGIVGMSKALNYAYTNLEFEKKYISDLKLYTQIELTKAFSNIQFIAENNSIFSILNVILPISPSKSSLLLFHLDLKGIAISRGSACQSGSSKPSHVLAEIVDAKNLEFPNLRISFSCYNTKKEIDYLVENLVLLQ